MTSTSPPQAPAPAPPATSTAPITDAQHDDIWKHDLIEDVIKYKVNDDLYNLLQGKLGWPQGSGREHQCLRKVKQIEEPLNENSVDKFIHDPVPRCDKFEQIMRELVPDRKELLKSQCKRDTAGGEEDQTNGQNGDTNADRQLAPLAHDKDEAEQKLAKFYHIPTDEELLLDIIGLDMFVFVHDNDHDSEIYVSLTCLGSER